MPATDTPGEIAAHSALEAFRALCIQIRETNAEIGPRSHPSETAARKGHRADLIAEALQLLDRSSNFQIFLDLRTAISTLSPEILERFPDARPNVSLSGKEISAFLRHADADLVRLALQKGWLIGRSIGRVLDWVGDHPDRRRLFLEEVARGPMMTDNFGLPVWGSAESFETTRRDLLAQLLANQIAANPDKAGQCLHIPAQFGSQRLLIALVLAGARPTGPLASPPMGTDLSSLFARVQSAHGRLEILREHGPLLNFLILNFPAR